MLAPPDTFAQLRPLAWAGPALAAFGAGFALWAHGMPPSPWLWGLTGAVALAAAVLAHLAIWASRWGRLHQEVTAIATLLLFVLPWSLMLTPRLQDGSLRLSIGIAGAELMALLASAAVHAHRCTLQARANRLIWSDCEIDVRRQVIAQVRRPGDRSTMMVAPSLIGGLSVAAYLFIQTLLPERSMLMVAVAISWALALWLCIGPLGRALGQAWRLRQIERQSGQRFVSEHLARLTQERQRSPIGRWWARRQS